jgi:DNA-binding XRE family transcriptional regulator|tara:strand:- start:1519 stop:1803 length:285 start_codon:yes stop_codon:yes gene_type:complete
VSKTDGEKIREIREAEGMGRQEFSEVTGIKKQTLISTETGRMTCSLKTVRQITAVFPKYRMWLVDNQVDEEKGQINPEIEKARRELKQTGTDTN